MKRTGILEFLIPGLLTISIFLGMIFLFILPETERICIEREKDSIQNMVRIVEDMIYGIIQDNRDTLSIREMQDTALYVIENLRYGPNNDEYFWVISLEGRMLAHPYRPDLIGTDITNIQDIEGFAFIRNIISQARQEGSGFSTYYWQLHAEEDNIRLKATYFQVFEPWGWIISTGLYFNNSLHRVRELTVLIIKISLLIIPVLIGLTILLIYFGIKNQNNLENTIRALAESESRYRDLVNTMNEGLIIQDSNNNLTFVNTKFAAMLGYKRDALVGSKTESIIAPGDKEYFRAHVSKPPEAQGIPYELRWLKKDNNVIHTVVSPRIIRNDTGKPSGSFAIITDISTQKQTENNLKVSLHEKEILLKEVHHRVKNNLQIISSLLNLQRDSSENEDIRTALAEAQSRITSMAQIHENLYESEDIAKVNMKTFVAQLTKSLETSFLDREKTVHISTDINEIYIEMSKAVSVGLIINELCSNAYKHAFSQQTKGNISISLQSNKNEITLIVKDNGSGVKNDGAILNGESLGGQLISALTQQIHGELKVFSTEEGTAVQIVFTL
ncbi:MAG: sensor histidine kinase [Spirochaetia bacterium]